MRRFGLTVAALCIAGSAFATNGTRMIGFNALSSTCLSSVKAPP